MDGADLDDEQRLPQSVLRSLREVDELQPDLRACVHEYGYAIVRACAQAGVVRPNAIRQLVHSIWDGARQPHQRKNFNRPRDEQESPVLDKLDWVLIQAGSTVGARALLRVLWQNGMAIIPTSPGSVMVKASMATVTRGDVTVSKEEKHKLRLKAAIDAQVMRLWPHLVEKS